MGGEYPAGRRLSLATARLGLSWHLLAYRSEEAVCDAAKEYSQYECI